MKKYYLYRINEATTPGIAVTDKVKKADKKENNGNQKDVAKTMKVYEKETTSSMPDSTIDIPKTDSGTEYHDEMEIMNGMEMLRFDNRPDKRYSERAKMAIEGDPKMGNSSEWANVVAKGQGGDPDFGKKLVKRISKSVKKRNDGTPTTKMFGDDWEVTPDEKKSPIAIQEMNTAPVKPNIRQQQNNPLDIPVKESEVDQNNTHFLTQKSDSKIVFAWDYSGLDRDSIKEYSKIDIKDMFPNNKPSDFKIISKNELIKRGINPMDEKNWLPQGKINESKTHNNKMKRLKFKKEFGGVDNALKMIPESYKVDNKEFVMTDGNETYTIKWEGSLTEGVALVLKSENKFQLDEDVKKIKHLMGFRAQETLGNLKGKERITENKKFMAILNEVKTKEEETTKKKK